MRFLLAIMKHTLCVFFATLIYFSARAQVTYPIFQQRAPIEEADSNKLTLNVNAFGYLHNTEFFTPIAHSGTLFGYQLMPELQYQPSPRFTIRLGLYAQKEFGRDEYTSLKPTFTAKYKARHSYILFGNLEGNTRHGFIEPIYDYKLIINERLENGFQFVVDTKPFWQDLYLNWRKAIHLGDPFKEEMDIGYSAKFKLIDREKYKLSIPVQMLYSHKGGQIDATNEPLTSLVNDAIGVSVTWSPNKRFLKGITLDNYYANYKDISGNKRQPYKQGNGYLAHLLFDFKHFDVDFRYWKGHKFINPRGNSLFSSVSEKYPGVTLEERRLLFASFIYDTEMFKGGHFHFKMTPYYDLEIKELEYFYEMYFSYSLQVFLGTIKNTL